MTSRVASDAPDRIGRGGGAFSLSRWGPGGGGGAKGGAEGGDSPMAASARDWGGWREAWLIQIDLNRYRRLACFRLQSLCLRFFVPRTGLS